MLMVALKSGMRSGGVVEEILLAEERAAKQARRRMSFMTDTMI